jgi:signal transduction histidine kinase
MDNLQNYSSSLEERLEARRESLDHAELPRLRDSFKLFQSSFEGLRVMLYKKGILHEDPYKYDLKISEVKNPPESQFAESEKTEQMSIRVSQYESYLEFLNNYYQFSTEFLTMGRIKRLLGLTKYFNFTAFADSSDLINTKSLAELVSMVKNGTDSLSIGILGDSLGHLDKATRDILSILKTLANYHKERYKLEVRRLAMSGLALDATLVDTHREEAVKQVKHRFAEVAADQPFYPELIEEILLEDFSPDGPALRDEVLRRFDLKVEKKAAGARQKTFRTILLDGSRILAGCARMLEDALAKLQDNSVLLESGNHSLGDRLKRMIRNLLSPGSKGKVYEVEYIDPVTSQHKSENLDFALFSEETGKKARLLASLLQKGSPAVKRIENMPEDQVYRFLERNLDDMQRIVRNLASLDEFFKSTMPVEERSRLKGIKVELTSLKSAVMKANQKKHEYVSQKEEQEQMRKLGIRDGST